MKKFIILLGLIAATLSVVAQEKNQFVFEMGRPSIYELTMKEYRADKSADAIVIYESGDFYFKLVERDRDYYYSIVKTYKTKIKILKESGIERAKFAIPVYKESEYIWDNFYIQTANVFNYDSTANKMIKTSFEDEEWLIDVKKIKEHKLNKNFVIKNFALRDVKVGSIIEVEYAIETPFGFSFQWQYQKDIPVVYSKIRYRTNSPLIYAYRLNSDKKFDEFYEDVIRTQSSTSKETAYVLGMKNIPAFKPGSKNEILTIYFQLKEQKAVTNTAFQTDVKSFEIARDWKEYSYEILGYDDFGKYIKKAEKEAKKILPKINLSGKNQQETMESILNFVKTNYNWNGLYGKYVLYQMPDFLERKNGNAANLNLFLIGLLNAAKIPATPVLVTPYNNGDVSKLHPFDGIFNYVIAAVTIGNTTYYLDAASFEKKTDITGFVVNKKGNLFVKIAQIEPNTINNLYPEKEKLDNDGELTLLLNSLKKVFYFLKN